MLSCDVCPLLLSLVVFYQAETGQGSKAGFREALDTLPHARAKADIRLRPTLGMHQAACIKRACIKRACIKHRQEYQLALSYFYNLIAFLVFLGAVCT